MYRKILLLLGLVKEYQIELSKSHFIVRDRKGMYKKSINMTVGNKMVLSELKLYNTQIDITYRVSNYDFEGAQNMILINQGLLCCTYKCMERKIMFCIADCMTLFNKAPEIIYFKEIN